MKEMSLIVRTIARFSLPLIATFGAYVIIHGHLTPGGGFQGGAVLASTIALLLVSFGKKFFSDMEKTEFKFSLVEAFGLIMFLGIGLMAIAASGMLGNFLADGGVLFGNNVNQGINDGDIMTAGVIPLFNIAVGLEVFGALGAIIMLFTFGFDHKHQGGDEE